MWGRRSIAALFALALVASACGGDDGGSSSGANDTSATTSDGGSDTSTGGGSGNTINDDHGKVNFKITGDATAEGELPFVYVEVLGMSGLSVYDEAQNGWAAWFGKGGDAKQLVQMHTGTGIFSYTDGDVLVNGVKDQGCTFNYSQNDKDGFKGSVDCKGAQVLKGTGTGKADIKATFEGHK